MRALFLALALLFTAPTYAAKVSAADEYCVAINLYYEARHEVESGMQGVAYVTLNRARHRHQSLCHVVFAYKQFSWVDQYKVLDGEGHIKTEFRPGYRDVRWILCKAVAKEAISHPERDITKGAEYFVAYYIFPKCLARACSWVKNLDYVDRFGSHLFFRERVVVPMWQLKNPYEEIVVIDQITLMRWYASRPVRSIKQFTKEVLNV